MNKKYTYEQMRIFGIKKQEIAGEVFDMTGKEYKSFLCIVGGLQLASQGIHNLKDGLRTHKFWGPFRRAEGIMIKNAQKILDMMTSKRASQYEQDKHFMNVQLGFRRLPGSGGTDCDVFKCAAVEKLAVHVLENECYLCDKTGAEGKKCPYSAALDAVTNGDLKPVNGRCKYCGIDIVRIRDYEVQP